MTEKANTWQKDMNKRIPGSAEWMMKFAMIKAYAINIGRSDRLQTYFDTDVGCTETVDPPDGMFELISA